MPNICICKILTFLQISCVSSTCSAQFKYDSSSIRAVPFCGGGQGLSCNASSVSFGHAEHCFLTVWTPKIL